MNQTSIIAFSCAVISSLLIFILIGPMKVVAALWAGVCFGIGLKFLKFRQ